MERHGRSFIKDQPLEKCVPSSLVFPVTVKTVPFHSDQGRSYKNPVICLACASAACCPQIHLVSLPVTLYISHAAKWLKILKSLIHTISVHAMWCWPIPVPLAWIPVLSLFFISLWIYISREWEKLDWNPLNLAFLWTCGLLALIHLKSVGWESLLLTSGWRCMETPALLHAVTDHVCPLWSYFKHRVQTMANLFHFLLHLSSLSHYLPVEIYWFPSAEKLFLNLARCNAWSWPSACHLWDRRGGSACSDPGGPTTEKWHLTLFLGPHLKVQQK